MKALGLALMAALVIGCSATPTSPSLDSGSASVLIEQDHKPNPTNTTHTISLFFMVNGLAVGRRPVGMPVDVWSASMVRQTLIVSPRGSVTFVVPARDTWFMFEVHTWNGVCGEVETINLPGGSLPEWNHTHNLKTGCF
jgi:hypothetical protein